MKKKLTKKSKGHKIGLEELEKIAAEVDFAREPRIALIQQLIPLVLRPPED